MIQIQFTNAAPHQSKVKYCCTSTMAANGSYFSAVLYTHCNILSTGWGSGTYTAHDTCLYTALSDRIN